MLEARSVGFRYPGQEAWVLRTFNICIRSGEICCLIGSNGSGKTTLARIFAGELVAEEGSVFGTESGKVAIRYQDYVKNLLPWYSAVRNLSLTQSQSEASVDMQDWIELSGFDRWGRKRVNSLSGGQKQLLSLLCVLQLGSTELILDEPFSALDPNVLPRVWSTARGWVKSKNIATLVITHNLEEALALGDTVVVIVDGSRGKTAEFSVKGNSRDLEYLASPATQDLRRRILAAFYGSGDP